MLCCADVCVCVRVQACALSICLEYVDPHYTALRNQQGNALEDALVDRRHIAVNVSGARHEDQLARVLERTKELEAQEARRIARAAQARQVRLDRQARRRYPVVWLPMCAVVRAPTSLVCACVLCLVRLGTHSAAQTKRRRRTLPELPLTRRQPRQPSCE